MSDSVLMHVIGKIPKPSTAVLVLLKVLLCIIPIAMIAVGAEHLDDCPRQRYIPVYLIVMGFFFMLLVISVYLPCTRQPKDGPPNPLYRLSLGWNVLLAVFLVAWFIAGNVWIYSIYKPNYHKNITMPEPYCDKRLYQFAFWTMTLFYILVGVIVALGLLALVCIYLFGQADPDDYI
ncbi:transmembrane protein 272-like [Syngnathus acus]|uniref:transmembrane protein 272-like n=1 Tax=Syngnathus acus TaxID=161584 RepID=UPI001885C086|nr:transmembrane protein 272-like [Syngnathus acus]XP_037116389.1 transmembrane protein 272-like [Syngnathus acus]XP_037116390.1 transmembrane protein 272-like [Syngnathus acus]